MSSLAHRTGLLRTLLWALLAVAIAFPVATVRRMPVPFADAQLYASIAIARHAYGVGVPTISWNSPVAVDHIPFYGPVFFDLCSLAQRLFGVTLFSFRVVSLLGTALYVWGTVLLARQLARGAFRPLLAAVLVLVAPEVSAGAGTGAMHMLALGFEMLALAVFVRGFDRRRGGLHYGLFAGLLLVCAALTTPRSYPFIFAFFVAGIAPKRFQSARLALRYRLIAAALVLLAGMMLFAVATHGSVSAWIRYLSYIFTHEDTDVAILPTAQRVFSFHWSGVLTPAVALAGGLLAAVTMRARPRGREEATDAALMFLLMCTWIEFVTTAVVLNYTFTIGEYIALPLLSVVVSWPALPLPRRAVIAAVLLVLVLDLGDMAFRIGAVGATWAARDPEAINRFVAEYVPAGSAVVGPEQPFLFPVERSFSRYRTVSPRSWADWARWVPIIQPSALLVPRRFPAEKPRARFLIWYTSEPPPDGYECAAPHAIAAFESAPIARWTPRWIRRFLPAEPGYPAATLYRLPSGCPTGYDPTHPPD